MVHLGALDAALEMRETVLVQRVAHVQRALPDDGVEYLAASEVEQREGVLVGRRVEKVHAPRGQVRLDPDDGQALGLAAREQLHDDIVLDEDVQDGVKDRKVYTYGVKDRKVYTWTYTWTYSAFVGDDDVDVARVGGAAAIAADDLKAGASACCSLIKDIGKQPLEFVDLRPRNAQLDVVVIFQTGLLCGGEQVSV